MKKFLILYWANAQAMEHRENASDEEKQKDMGEWFEWVGRNAKNFVDEGNPVAKNTRITTGKGVEEVSNEVSGYSIVQAENKEAALKILQWNPHTTVEWSYIELMEIVDIEM